MPINKNNRLYKVQKNEYSQYNKVEFNKYEYFNLITIDKSAYYHKKNYQNENEKKSMEVLKEISNI